MLQAFAARKPLPLRIAIVVAHPDDETIAAGASLHLMPGLLLVHVTDGAPRQLDDAQRHGFPTPAAYAAAREAELQQALAVAAVRPERARLDIPDQDAVLHVRPITARLAQLFVRHGTQAVLTHAYEGGHPDHDATAFAVHQATAPLGLPVFEFAGYHAGPGARTVVQRFLPGPAETAIHLAPEEAARKKAMFDCFQTQRSVLEPFDPGIERFRPAPRIDFSQAPHPGALNYENWGWDMTGARWRTLVAGEARCAA